MAKQVRLLEAAHKKIRIQGAIANGDRYICAERLMAAAAPDLSKEERRSLMKKLSELAVEYGGAFRAKIGNSDRWFVTRGTMAECLSREISAYRNGTYARFSGNIAKRISALAEMLVLSGKLSKRGFHRAEGMLSFDIDRTAGKAAAVSDIDSVTEAARVLLDQRRIEAEQKNDGPAYSAADGKAADHEPSLEEMMGEFHDASGQNNADDDNDDMRYASQDGGPCCDDGLTAPALESEPCGTNSSEISAADAVDMGSDAVAEPEQASAAGDAKNTAGTMVKKADPAEIVRMLTAPVILSSEMMSKLRDRMCALAVLTGTSMLYKYMDDAFIAAIYEIQAHPYKYVDYKDWLALFGVTPDGSWTSESDSNKIGERELKMAASCAGIWDMRLDEPVKSMHYSDLLENCMLKP